LGRKCNNVVRVAIYSTEDFINTTYKRAKKGEIKMVDNINKKPYKAFKVRG
jgi:hypothetical protein